MSETVTFVKVKIAMMNLGAMDVWLLLCEVALSAPSISKRSIGGYYTIGMKLLEALSDHQERCILL
jgi:hypothetical protein